MYKEIKQLAKEAKMAMQTAQIDPAAAVQQVMTGREKELDKIINKIPEGAAINMNKWYLKSFSMVARREFLLGAMKDEIHDWATIKGITQDEVMQMVKKREKWNKYLLDNQITLNDLETIVKGEFNGQ